MRKLLLSFLCFFFMINTTSASDLDFVPMKNGIDVWQFYKNLKQPSNVFKSVAWGGKIDDESYPHYKFDSYLIFVTPYRDIIGMDVDENGENAPIIVRTKRDTGEIIGLKMFFRTDAGNYSGNKLMALILYSIFGSNYRNYRPIANGIDRFFSGEDKVTEQIESNGKTLCLARTFPTNDNLCVVAVFIL